MEFSKEQFGIEITKLLKDRKLTQRGLADCLGITSAAVCYMLKNKLRPSAVQFDKIMEFLQTDAFQINYLRNLWNATQKENGTEAEEKDNLFSIRCARGVTVEEVSQSTGISPERLRVLENKAEAKPTPDEAKRLKKFYGVNPPGLRPLPGEDDTSTLRIAEEFSGDLRDSKKNLPVFTSTDTLSRAAKAGSLEGFLGGLPFNNANFNIAACHVQRAKAVLICDAEDIHYGFKGSVELVLGDFDPESTDPLHLGRGSRGGFALWQKMRRSWKYFGAEHPAPRMLNTWSLPVLEFYFTAAPHAANSCGKKK